MEIKDLILTAYIVMFYVMPLVVYCLRSKWPKIFGNNACLGAIEWIVIGLGWPLFVVDLIIDLFKYLIKNL